MAVESSPPPSARIVYTALGLLVVVAALVAFSTIGYIVHQYVTREELRNPLEQVEEHAQMPSFSLLV